MTSNADKKKAIARAEKVIDSEAENYDQALAASLGALDRAYRDGDLAGAARCAQNIAGEAPQFGWRTAAEIAVTLRNILESPEMESKEEASRLALSSLQLIVMRKWKSSEESGDALNQSLQTMAAALGAVGAANKE